MSIQSARPSAVSPPAIPATLCAAARACAGNFRWLRLITILAAFGGMAANYGSHPGVRAVAGGGSRSRHFEVHAATPEFAREVCLEAERFRQQLAIVWLGRELPPWQDLCPIHVTVGSHLGAGGATSFTFVDGQPRDWEMSIQGSRARILDSVLPHEITHTILATHFGRPLPRWADEGAATSVEHASERTKQDRLLIEFLTTDRGIAFNHMFAMREYPQDILPLYSQGYSLARYLIAREGKRAFIEYVGDGMRWNNWTAATQKHYQMRSLSELQLTWLDWVRQGSPELPADTALASHTQPVPGSSGPDEPVRVTNGAHGLTPLPPPDTLRAQGLASVPAPAALADTSPSEGWYSRRRDEVQQQSSGTTTTLQPIVPPAGRGREQGGRWLR